MQHELFGASAIAHIGIQDFTKRRMAVYHFHTKTFSRSSRNTVGAVAYRAGIRLVDERTGEVFDYRDKPVDAVELFVGDNAPEWAVKLKELIATNRAEGVGYFSALCESHEARKDARVYRELEVALPCELNKEQNIELVRRFSEKALNVHGVMVLANFHHLSEKNPHCHIVLTTRSMADEGLSSHKVTDLNAKQWLYNVREQWANVTNDYLKELGIDASIDHRSYKERGIDLEGQPKLGRNVQEMEKRSGQNPKDVLSTPTTQRGQVYQEVKLRNLYEIISNPDVILQCVSEKQSTFMWGDILKYMARYVDDQKLFSELQSKIQKSKQLICLEGSGPSDIKGVFTTRDRLASEQDFVNRVNRLHGNSSHRVDQTLVDSKIDEANQGLQAKLNNPNASLSTDQVQAIQDMSKATQICMVEGYAGTGKTTVMSVMRDIWQQSGYRVFGVAPTGRAADNLAECGIQSTTVHSFLKTYDQDRNQLNKNTVLVLDEAGMVDHKRFSELLKAVETLGVKLVALGDRGQLSPVEAGVPFRLAIDEIGRTELSTVLRQKVDWQREATVQFGRGEAREALEHYMDHGRINFVEESFPSCRVEQYNLSRRITGNIFHTINKDIEEAKTRGIELDFKSHQDYDVFIEWLENRQQLTENLFKNIEQYKPRMRELGVNGVDFAKKVIQLRLSPEDSEVVLARKLGLTWRASMSHICDPRLETKREMISDWFTSTQDRPEDTQAMMAHSNKDVMFLNDAARQLMKRHGDIGERDFTYTIERIAGEELGKQVVVKEQRTFSLGDQILFTKNDRGLGVKNGTIGKITELNQDKISVEITQENGTQHISFAPKLNPHFDNGWAVTIHKNQGVTVDRAFYLTSFEQYKNLSYVALTRHSKDVQVYASDHDFWREEILLDRLGRTQDKLSSLDYDPGSELSIDKDQKHLSQFLEKVGHKLSAIHYVSHRGWQNLCDRFLGRVSKHDQIHISTDMAQWYKSESDRAAELFAKTQDVDLKTTESQKNDGAELSKIPKQDASRSETTSDATVDAVEKQAAPHAETQQPELTSENAAAAVEGREPQTDTQQDPVDRVPESQIVAKEQDVSQSEIQKTESTPDVAPAPVKDQELQTSTQRDLVDQVSESQSVSKEQAASHAETQHSELTSETTAAPVEEQSPDTSTQHNPVDQTTSSQTVSKEQDASHAETQTSETAAAIVEGQEPQTNTQQDPVDRVPESQIVAKEKDVLQSESQKTESTSDVVPAPVKDQELQTNTQRDLVDQAASSQIVSEEQVASHPKTQKSESTSETGAASLEEQGSATGKQQGFVDQVSESQINVKEQDAARLETQQSDSIPEAAPAPVNDQDPQASQQPESIDPSPEGSKESVSDSRQSEPLRSKSYLQEKRISADQILEAAKGQYRDLALEILGPENKRKSTASELWYGRKGSLKVTLQGPYEGKWYDFERDEGGDIFTLLKREQNLEFKEAIDHLASRLGVRPDLEFKKFTPKKQRQTLDATLVAENKDKLQSVNTLYQLSTPVTGTKAAQYLQKRGITCDPAGDVRALPKGTKFTYKGQAQALKYDSIASFARDHEGKLLSVQITRLNNSAQRARTREGDKIPKTKYGMGSKGFVTLQSNPQSNTVVIAEGVETALSLKQAGVQSTIVSSQGIHNIKNYAGPEQTIIIAADWDGSRDNPAWDMVEKAQKELTQKNNNVSIMLPVNDPELTKAKIDFNDVLVKNGAKSVQEFVATQAPKLLETQADRQPENESQHHETRQNTDPFIDQSNRSRTRQTTTSLETQKVPLEKNPEPQHHPDFIKQNVLKYFEHELSKPEHAREDKQDMLDSVKKDPLDALKWWQNNMDGSQFDPKVPFDQQAVSRELITKEAIHQNIMTYFEHELSKPEHTSVDKQDMLDDVKRNPLDALKWWQDNMDGSQFDPKVPFDDQKGAVQNRNEPAIDHQKSATGVCQEYV